jgi:hypothetical protein
MAQLFQENLPDFVIPSGSANSNALDWTIAQDAESITIFAPATLPEACGFQGSPDGGATYNTIVDGTNTAIAAPTAGNVIIYNGVFSALLTLRLHANGNVAADRIFKAFKSWRA